MTFGIVQITHKHIITSDSILLGSIGSGFIPPGVLAVAEKGDIPGDIQARKPVFFVTIFTSRSAYDTLCTY